MGSRIGVGLRLGLASRIGVGFLSKVVVGSWDWGAVFVKGCGWLLGLGWGFCPRLWLALRLSWLGSRKALNKLDKSLPFQKATFRRRRKQS